MTKELIKPTWYDDEFYNKSRTPEEWLFEFWKRVQFNQDETGFPSSFHMLSVKEQESHFISLILNQQIEKFLSSIKASPPQPIKYPSVSDIFIMYHLVKKSEWYVNNPNRDAFERAISTILNKGTLSSEEKVSFGEMYNKPWCAYHENHQQDNWCPKHEIEHLTGIPISIDPGYAKKDTIEILKKKLNAWVGKLQGVQCQFERWQESKILAVFDLTLWFKIQRVQYKNIDIHKLIWPNGRISSLSGEEVNPYDDIDHSIDLANRIINKNILGTLLMMCEVRKFKREKIAQ